MKRIMPIIFTIALALLLCGFSQQDSRKNNTAKPKAGGYTIPRQITYGFTLCNTSDQVAKEMEFWTYAPASRTSTQECGRIETSHPYNLITDDLGNQVLHFTFKEFPPFGTMILRIRANLLISKTARVVPGADMKACLSSRKYIESDDAGVCLTAKQLSGASPYKTAENMYSWTAKNIRYTGYCPYDRGALFALKNREGDCTEFTYLFVALCRAGNIPARCMGGYLYGGNASLEPDGYHNWAEFYQDGSWRMADPQKRVFVRNQADYVVMRVFGCGVENPAGDFHRFKCSDDRIKVTMNG